MHRLPIPLPARLTLLPALPIRLLRPLPPLLTPPLLLLVPPLATLPTPLAPLLLPLRALPPAPLPMQPTLLPALPPSKQVRPVERRVTVGRGPHASLRKATFGWLFCCRAFLRQRLADWPQPHPWGLGEAGRWFRVWREQVTG